MTTHLYEVRPRRDNAAFNLTSGALPFGRLWYGAPDATSNAVELREFCSRSHRAVIRVYDSVGNVIKTHKRRGAFKEP